MSVLKFKALLLVLCIAVVQVVSAGQDYCLPGSDALCKRYGTDYCCAKIKITKNGVEDSYHACASASGIDYMDGKFSGGGYSGTWYCDQAQYFKASLFIMASSLYLTI